MVSQAYAVEPVESYMSPLHGAEQSPLLMEVDHLPEGSAAILNELPEFNFVVRRARQVGESILNERMDLLREGEFDAVPMPVDMTGTARRVVEAEQNYGAWSPQALIAHQSLDDDIDRQVAEIESKMTWGYFEPLTHLYSPEEQGFTAYGRSLRELTANGISPMLDPEDTERAINDYTMQNLDEAFIHSEYAGDYVLFTIAECADWAIDKYDRDQAIGNTKTTYGGLVPENQKMMIQCLTFDTEEGERNLEQVGVPGTYIDREVLHEALRVLGAIKPGEQLTKTELQGKRIMVKKDVMNDVLDMQKLLDQLATERNGQQIFMGEAQSTDVLMSYEDVPAEALRRQEEYSWLKKRLKNEMLQLERDGVNKWQTEAHISAFLQKELLAVVKDRPEEAYKIFNADTAEGFIKYQELQAKGQFDEAIKLQEEIIRAAPMPSSCGAGSCGLEGVSTTGDAGKDLMKKLGADSTDSIVRDTERACRCGKKSIVYAYNKSKVTKYCESCGSFESKYKKAA